MFSWLVDRAHAMGAGGVGGADGPDALMGMLPLLAMFVIFYFLLIRPQQKKAKAHAARVAAIQRGDDVVTSGGIIGKVTGVTDENITVEIAEKVRVKLKKDAVISINNS
jgi:preprotein translocase subunit YajC